VRKGRGRTSHEDPWHILITPGHDDHAVEPVGGGGGFDLICDEVAGLERVGHAGGAHADAIANTDSAELVANDRRLGEGGFYVLAEGEEVFVASVG
jgi:hypothetical protein